jgi:hypothetical protein
MQKKEIIATILLHSIIGSNPRVAYGSKETINAAVQNAIKYAEALLKELKRSKE